jgi:hypothetical protein
MYVIKKGSGAKQLEINRNFEEKRKFGKRQSVLIRFNRLIFDFSAFSFTTRPAQVVTAIIVATTRIITALANGFFNFS